MKKYQLREKQPIMFFKFEIIMNFPALQVRYRILKYFLSLLVIYYLQKLHELQLR
jgi:hypothetical protein